jgi:hypothetical protein
MNFFLYAFASLLTLSMAATNLSADNLYPVADMYTDPEHSGQHPTEEIWVANYSPSGNFQRLMMKFDFDQYMGHTVDGAILNLHRFFGCPSGGVTGTIMYNITIDWMDNTWPENVHIDYGDTEYGWYNFSVNGWHQIDITNIVRAWLSGDIPNYGFVLVATSGSKFSKFYSREASESLRPYLELTTHTAIDDDPNSLPSSYAVNAYPNPFNATTTIEYSLPQASGVTVEIYNLLGQSIAVLTSDYLQAGYHSIVWNSGDNPSGLYFVRIATNGYSQSRKLVLLK